MGFLEHKKNRYLCNDFIPLYSPIYTQNHYGGGGGIRTPAGFDTPVGFQDRSLQPDLGTPP